MKNETMNNSYTEMNDRLRVYSVVNQENLETSYTGCDIFSSYSQDRFGQYPSAD